MSPRVPSPTASRPHPPIFFPPLFFFGSHLCRPFFFPPLPPSPLGGPPSFRKPSLFVVCLIVFLRLRVSFLPFCCTTATPSPTFRNSSFSFPYFFSDRCGGILRFFFLQTRFEPPQGSYPFFSLKLSLCWKFSLPCPTLLVGDITDA